MNPLTLALVLATTTTAPIPKGPVRDVWTGGSIPMVFSGLEVGHALKAVGLRTGASIVYAAGKEKPEVTLNVTAATPEEAIRSVASAAGLVVRRVGRTYVVAPPTGMRQALEPYSVSVALTVEGDATAVVPRLQETLPYTTVWATSGGVRVQGTPDDVEAARAVVKDYADASVARRTTSDVVSLTRAVPSVVAPLLAGLYPDVKIVPTTGDKPGGALALSGPGLSVEAARDAARRLDEANPAQVGEFRVYDVRYASAQSLMDILRQAAPDVEAFAGPEAYQPKRASFNPLTAGVSGIVGTTTTASGATTGTSAVVATSPTGTTLPNAPLPASERAKTIILRGRTADVDAAVSLLTRLDRKPRQVVVEVNVFETTPELDENVGLNWNFGEFHFYEVPKASLIPDALSVTKPAGLGAFSRAPFDFNAKLNLMVTHKEAKILARPSVRVVDDGQASVFIGDTYRAKLVTGGALGAQNVTIQEFPVGIILLLAPRVNADGNITLHVNPVVSTITSVDADNIPQTSAREAETTAIVKDGETVVLGGLIRDEDVRAIQEVPFLSKLPIVGELFRNRTRTHRRSDILVSITPRLIPDDEPLPGGKR